jgi:hypothetical protein
VPSASPAVEPLASYRRRLLPPLSGVYDVRGPHVSARDLPSGGLLGRHGFLAEPDPALGRGPVAQLGLGNCFVFIYFTELMLDSKIHIS